MTLKLNIPNPCEGNKKALSEIKLFCHKNGITVDYKLVEQHTDYCDVFCSISNGTSTYSTNGYAQYKTTHLDCFIEASICAITDCLKAIGVSVDFLLSSEPVVTTKIENVNRSFIMSCPDVDYALRHLKRMGIDVSHVEKYRIDLVNSGSRLSKRKLAEFMFPHNSKTVVVTKGEDPVINETPVVDKEKERVFKASY